jgi:hypothetical protein
MRDAPRLTVISGGNDGLGNYTRVGRNDHNVLSQAVVEGARITGLVFEAGYEERHRELRAAAHSRGIETVLDSMAMELATPGGVERGAIHELPWGSRKPQTPTDLSAQRGREFTKQLAEFVSVRGLFTAVIAPTHFNAGPSSDWFARDMELAARLREQLDPAVLMYYRLATSTSAMRDPAKLAATLSALRLLDIDGLWLRLHPFGTTNAGPLSLRGYISSARQLHSLDVPIVGEHTGTVGVAIASCGAIGGVESGVTIGERVDMTSLVRSSGSNEPFAPAPRVYLRKLGTFMSRDQAAMFLGNRSMKAAFVCDDPLCCRRGVVDMLARPREHFLVQRSKEIKRLSDAPWTHRDELYMSEFLRPASDQAVRASQFDESLLPVRRRLESWRVTLSNMRTEGAATTRSRPALGSRHKRNATTRRAQDLPR